jgi:probable phosphomutase (TIGR03848 family)
MTTVLLIRHGRTTANSSGVLAGWTPGVSLDEVGQQQASRLAVRLSSVTLAAVVTSPLERCRETTALLTRADTPEPQTDDRVGECHYGDWTGRALKDLAKDPLWKVVQAHPSAVTFPGTGGESLRAVQARGVDAIRDWNIQVGESATYAVVSHGDVIKAIAADALGLHLDSFQRIVIDPCSVTAIRYTATRPFVLRMNDTGGDLTALFPPRRRRRRRASSDAAVGGGAG